jgi:uncharacterized protein YndB with AHSA1/START domain
MLPEERCRNAVPSGMGGCQPRTSALYALNEVDVKAPPEVVWKLLVDAQNWSSYFPAEDQVKILSGEPELVLGTRYSRVTVGFPMHLIVTECVPSRRLSWSTVVDGDETGSSAYHGWVITPTDTGCHVLTEETQQGPFFLEEIGRKHPVRFTAITRNGPKVLRAQLRRIAPCARLHSDMQFQFTRRVLSILDYAQHVLSDRKIS